MLNDDVKTYLESLGKELFTVGFKNELEIAQQIHEILKNSISKYSLEDLAEKMAFEFTPDYPKDDYNWDTYYGPMFILPNEQGNMQEYPSLQKITSTILEYWQQRALESQNPILALRYADLVLDFTNKITNQSADYKLVQIIIDCTLKISDNPLIDPLNIKLKLKRALDLAIKFNNSESIKLLKKIIINFDAGEAIDNVPALWVFPFQDLMLKYSKKISLEELEKDTLIQSLEIRLNRIKKNAFLTEHAVVLLAEYYSSKKDEINLVRVLAVLEKSLKRKAVQDKNALLKISMYEKMLEIYQKYMDQGFKQIRMAHRRILNEISRLNLNWKDSLKELTVKQEISQDQIDRIVEDFLGKKGSINLRDSILKIIVNFLPRKNNIESDFENISNKYPLRYVCTNQIISSDGIPVAKLSGLEINYESYLIKYAAEHLVFNYPWLMFILQELKKRISKQDILLYLKKTSLFKEELYLERAIFSYWDDDFLVASHLFMPMIENAIRKLILACGGVILKLNKSAGYDRVTLGNFLRLDERGQGKIINELFAHIIPDICFYFRLVLIDSLGMNLRDDWAHGLHQEKGVSTELCQF